jgi:acetyltransferase-like isoleucine patch superfamily enzyme
MFLFKNILHILLFYFYVLTNNKSKFYSFSIIKKSKFGDNNIISKSCHLNKIILGDFSYIGKNCNIEYTSIGKYCSIGQNVTINLPSHPLKKNVSTHPIFYSNKYKEYNNLKNTNFKEFQNVKIGNDVWIGSNVIIMGGIEIFDGAVVAAGTIVTRNIGPYEIHAGIPNKLIKKRFTDLQIQSLLDVKWWNYPINFSKLSIYNDIDLFLNND